MRRALTIAGSDSGGGAGIQADLKSFAAFGVYGTSVITAVTAQNTLGVTAAAALPADLVTTQIDAIVGDIRIDAVKIGMLSNAAIVEAVVSAIEELALPHVVLDPVMASSSGERLLDDDGIQALRLELLPRVRVATPNITEAEVLSGLRITSSSDRRRAAERIHQMGAEAVIITGGHLSDAEKPDEVTDLLFDDGSFTEITTRRVAAEIHGTGCTFSAALAAGLALGESLAVAAARAQKYVAGAMTHGLTIGRGAGVLHHFWRNNPPERSSPD
jgi:hydroxymethylpyrimidine/phosphomethylpyrimidine kinase